MKSANIGVVLDVIKKAVLAAVSIAAVITLHELTHLIVGRLVGIPAVFTGMTSAGVTTAEAAHYPPSSLEWMNGIAPLSTVVLGFVIYALLKRRSTMLHPSVRYFFAWCAIFGIPYLGIQLLIVVADVDYSGNGADSAAIAGYLHLPFLLRVILHSIGFLYYMISAVWVLGVMRAALPGAERVEATGAIAPWRRRCGLLLILLAIACIAFDAVNMARHGNKNGTFLLVVLLAWTIALVLLTRWKDPVVRSLALQWLLPGAIGMIALTPLSFADARGNDYAQIWQFSLPPVIASMAFATYNITRASRIVRLSTRRSPRALPRVVT